MENQKIKNTDNQKTPVLTNKKDNKSSKNTTNKNNRISVHDLYFKSHFSQLGKAKKLLPLVLTSQEQKLFNWNSLKAEKDSFPENKRADLIFSLGFKSLPKKESKSISF